MKDTGNADICKRLSRFQKNKTFEKYHEPIFFLIVIEIALIIFLIFQNNSFTICQSLLKELS